MLDLMGRDYSNLHTFIHNLLKNCGEKYILTAEAKDILNNMTSNLVKRYAMAATQLCIYADKVTIDSNVISTLTKLWARTPSTLLENAHEVWRYYLQNTVKGLSKHRRAGLCIPPARIETVIKEYQGIKQKIGEAAAIFLAAIVEQLLLNLLKQIIKDLGTRVTITGAHIYKAVPDLAEDLLFQNTFIPGYGLLNDSCEEDYLDSE